MDPLKLHTPDFTQQNVDKIAALFPSCVTEAEEDGKLVRVVDFDQLRQELSDSIVDGPRERYRLDWPGKREAIATANAPIAKTLRPCREESVDFDTTKNLYIEGDNLEALKLLQETYLNKVKMIYIDPPYNTGNDFVYNDDFKETSEEYFERSNQKDEHGNRMVANSDANGRYHSDWLTMIYPRLKLARNLLSEDGVVIISIDDNEVHNLRKVCDEVLGAENFVTTVIWEKKYSPQNDARYFSDMHDYIAVYAKTKELWQPIPLPRTADQDKAYKNPDSDPRGPWKASDATCNKTRAQRPNLYYPVEKPDGEVIYPKETRVWAISKDLYRQREADNRIWWGGDNQNNTPSFKSFLSEVKSGRVPTTLWKYTDVGHTQLAKQSLKLLFPESSFDTPKPVPLIEMMLKIVSSSSSEDTVLDFFSGSATTAHAVMQRNAEDGGSRQHIMVQLPEACDEKSAAYKAGYRTIAEIGKERIRRAGTKISTDLKAQIDSIKQSINSSEEKLEEVRMVKSSSPKELARVTTIIEANIAEYQSKLDEVTGKHTNLDTGFRVLKVDSSNMNEVFYRPDAVSQNDLFSQTDNIRDDRSSEDLLFQVLLDWGVDLTLPITRKEISGKEVFFVDDNALAACFDTDLDEDFVKALAKHTPLRAVFRDTSYSSDSTKINIEQIFKLLSPHTELKTL